MWRKGGDGEEEDVRKFGREGKLGDFFIYYFLFLFGVLK